MKRWSIVCGAAMIVLLAVSGCSVMDMLRRDDGEGVTETPESAEPGQPPREITGQEALELYGVEAEVPEPTRTPEYWFPMKAVVLENILPYDPEETIDILAVFTREELSEGEPGWETSRQDPRWFSIRFLRMAPSAWLKERPSRVGR